MKQSLLHVWHNVGQDITKNFVPNCLNEVIKMNGYLTT